MNILNVLAKTHLKYDQNAADDAGVSVNHGLLHDVTYEAEVAGLHGLFSYEGSQVQITAGRQQVELMDAHGTNMMEQLVYHFGCAYHFFCHKETKIYGESDTDNFCTTYQHI